MPHIIIEFSDNLTRTTPVKDMVHDMHHALDGLYHVTLDRVKTRAIPCAFFHAGTAGEQGSFIHVTLRLLPGRTAEQKAHLSEILFDVATRYCPDAARSVEVVDLDGASYRT